MASRDEIIGRRSHATRHIDLLPRKKPQERREDEAWLRRKLAEAEADTEAEAEAEEEAGATAKEEEERVETVWTPEPRASEESPAG